MDHIFLAPTAVSSSPHILIDAQPIAEQPEAPALPPVAHPEAVLPAFPQERDAPPLLLLKDMDCQPQAPAPVLEQRPESHGEGPSHVQDPTEEPENPQDLAAALLILFSNLGGCYSMALERDGKTKQRREIRQDDSEE